MPPQVVPAVATTMTGTTPAALSARSSVRGIGIHAPAAVGVDQAQRGASDACLVRDLEPRDVAFARGIEGDGPGKARAPSWANCGFASVSAHSRAV
jgi:hypothetical protein